MPVPFLSLNRSTTTLCHHKALTIDDGKRVLEQAKREGCFGHRRWFVFKRDPRFVSEGIDGFTFSNKSLLYKENGQSKEIQDLQRYTFQETFDGHTLGSFIQKADCATEKLFIDTITISFKGHHLALLFDKKLWIPYEKYDSFLEFVSRISSDDIFRWIKKLYPTHILKDGAKEMIRQIYSLFDVVHTFEEGMEHNNVARRMRDSHLLEEMTMMEDQEFRNLAGCICSALNHLFDFDFPTLKQKIYNRIKMIKKLMIETSHRLGPPETASTVTGDDGEGQSLSPPW